MNEQPYGCQSRCECGESRHNSELIVLTGGPGAGKTAVLESVRKVLCEHVAIIPEAAGIVFGGGFWRLESENAQMASQRAIFHIQAEMENLVRGEKKWGIGLCDRGTLDGLAYWKGSHELFWETFNTSLESEYSRYKAIIHLRSPSLDHGYNHQNPIRIESADEAAQIDGRIKEIWQKHPNYNEVKSSDSFLDKMNNAISLIKNDIPECCRGHFR